MGPAVPGILDIVFEPYPVRVFYFEAGILAARAAHGELSRISSKE